MESKLFYTYTLPRQFKDMNIPINIQSCFLRDYCGKNGFTYVLPQTEIINSGCTHILESLLIKISTVHNTIGITSIFMLPYLNREKISTLQNIDRNDHLDWHFPLEATVCKSSQLLKLTDEHKWLEAASSNSAELIQHHFLK